MPEGVHAAGVETLADRVFARPRGFGHGTVDHEHVPPVEAVPGIEQAAHAGAQRLAQRHLAAALRTARQERAGQIGRRPLPGGAVALPWQEFPAWLDEHLGGEERVDEPSPGRD